MRTQSCVYGSVALKECLLLERSTIKFRLGQLGGLLNDRGESGSRRLCRKHFEGLTSILASDIHLLHAVRQRMNAVPRGLASHRIIGHALVGDGGICSGFWGRRCHGLKEERISTSVLPR